jgi:hypothetical protein
VARDEPLNAFRQIALNAMEHGAGFLPDEMIEVTAVRTRRTWSTSSCTARGPTRCC